MSVEKEITQKLTKEFKVSLIYYNNYCKVYFVDNVLILLTCIFTPESKLCFLCTLLVLSFMLNLFVECCQILPIRKLTFCYKISKNKKTLFYSVSASVFRCH